MKKKTYILMLSKHFPVTHPKNGEPTFFREKVLSAVFGDSGHWQKIHTIRENYDLWKRRIMDVRSGDAYLSIRQWTGKPYRSKTVEVTRLTDRDDVGIQRLNFGWRGGRQVPVIEGWYMDGKMGSKEELAKNDGLELQDWLDWFGAHGNDTVEDKPLAIIHFTKFRY